MSTKNHVVHSTHNSGPCRYEPSTVCYTQEAGVFVAWQCEACPVKVDYVKEKKND